MLNLLKGWLTKKLIYRRAASWPSRHKAPGARRTRLGLETLEYRELLSASPMLGNVPLLFHETGTIHPTMVPQNDPSRAIGIVEETVPGEGTSLGTGTLVAPDWVLTAAHVVYNARMHRGQVFFFVGGYGTSNAVEADGQAPIPVQANDVRVLDGYTHITSPVGDSQDSYQTAHDLALIHLTRRTVGVPWLPIYDGTDQVGQGISLAGFGRHDALDVPSTTGPTAEFGTNRWGINRFSGVDSAVVTFQANGGAMIGHGDSGGPELIATPQIWHTWVGTIVVHTFAIAGVNSATSGGSALGVRTDVYRNWISSIIPDFQHIRFIGGPGSNADIFPSINVTSFRYGNDGSSVFALDDHGTLWANGGFAWEQIDTGVRSFTLASDGTAYGLNYNGDAWRWNNTLGYLLLDRNVQSLITASDGTAYGLNYNGDAWRYGAGREYQLLDHNVQSLITASDGTAYGLNTNGNAWRWNNTLGYLLLDRNVQSLITASDGTAYGVNRNGDAWRWHNILGYQLLDHNVQSLITASDGTAYGLNTNGDVWRWNNTLGYLLLDYNVQSIAIGSDGTLIVSHQT